MDLGDLQIPFPKSHKIYLQLFKVRRAGLSRWQGLLCETLIMRAPSFTLLAGLATVCQADVYMQYPPGSNNRLAEGGGNRNNNNRLMDTQNNAKGGYGYGGEAAAGTGMGNAAPLKYMAGSKLSMAWTSQHSCGSENAECQIVIQYM